MGWSRWPIVKGYLIAGAFVLTGLLCLAACAAMALCLWDLVCVLTGRAP